MSLNAIAVNRTPAVTATPAPTPDFVITMRDHKYELPDNLQVKPGMVIQIVNGEPVDDPAPHTVTSDKTGADGKPLFRIRLRQGESALLTITDAMVGEQPFHCEIHSFMHGKFTVLPADPTPAAAQTRRPGIRDEFVS